jgi:hypothetical protein
MYKRLLFAISFFALLSFTIVKAQISAGFENVNLNAQGFYNGSDLANGFQSNGLYFRNTYNPNFMSWDGFGVSNQTDTTTQGFSNQYSTYAGAAAEGNKFGIVYVFGTSFLKNNNPNQTIKLNSFKFSNSTWAGLTMKNGDPFSKKFGGPTGNDPDYFKILVFNHYNGIVTDTAEIFLADFRFADNSQDYIVKNWQTASFNFSSPFDSLSFELESTDNGAFGMNTPAYFCIDEIQYSVTTEIAKTDKATEIQVFPNPFTDKFDISSGGKNAKIEIRDQLGRLVDIPNQISETITRFDTQNLRTGIYFLSVNGVTKKILKH